jgi:hypothetical protein
MLKPIEASSITSAINADQDRVSVDVINKIFKVLHGRHGQVFLSKYSTGQRDEDGKDKGIIAARQVWAHDLRNQSPQAIMAALDQAAIDYTEFPPSGPQFLLLCKNQARDFDAVERVERSRLRIEVSGKSISESTKTARDAAMAKIRAPKPDPVPETGISLLMSLIAGAVALAGGDEVSELMRLERAFFKVAQS